MTKGLLQVFDSYLDFENREDKKVNGFSKEMVDLIIERYGSFEIEKWKDDQESNIGCWNCIHCTDCESCYDCRHCDACTNSCIYI